MTEAGATAKPAPAPADFVFQRWAELADDDPPWWSRPSGIGLRLLLDELKQLAVARSSGAIAKEAVGALISEAQRYLFGESSFCRRRFGAASDSIRATLTDKSPENWLPGAAGPSAIAAALEVIDDEKFVPSLLEVLQEEVTKAGEATGEMELAQALTEVEAMVELLDAELVRDGHSRQWRRRVADDAQARCGGADQVAQAITEALAANKYGQRRSFDCFVIACEYEEPSVGRLGNALEVEEALSRVIRPWNTADLADAIKEFETLDAVRLLRYEPHAADIDAAARTVSHEFTRDADLWRLRGGVVTATGERALLINDPDEGVTRLLDLPVEPLDVLPRRLGLYTPDPNDEPSRVDDALVQLAQARLAPPGTAIVDVWTAAEALFGGVVGESVFRTVDVVAGLAELLYLHDLFRWLGQRYENAGVGGAPGVESSRWGFERTLEGTTEVLAALATSSDALGWWRMKIVTGWTTSVRLREQLNEFGVRTKQVGARAYLARNTVVHNAEVRRQLIEITLPVFAGVVRECVGYIANHGEPDESLKTATKAAMTISHMANRVANQAVKAHEAIPELLPDEPGMQVADEGAPETGAVVAPTPGEPVPVEDLKDDGPVTGAEQQPEGDGHEPAEDEATTAPPTEQD
jgi:hypothetical protein